MNVSKFIDKYSLAFRSEKVHTRPDALESTWLGCSHFLCSITRTRGQYVFFFSMGSAHKGKSPTLRGVLECLSGDANVGNMSYKEACREFGTELAMSTYEQCRNTRDGIVDVFGRDGLDDLLSIEF